MELYADFISVYDKTSKSLDRSVLDHIETLSKDYGEYSNKFAIVFTIIYLGMVAEENKLGTKLGKRIKRFIKYCMIDILLRQLLVSVELGLTMNVN